MKLRFVASSEREGVQDGSETCYDALDIVAL